MDSVNEVEKNLKRGVYQTKLKQGKSVIWQSFSIVFDTNGNELDFVSCNKYAKILVYSTYNEHKSGTVFYGMCVCDGAFVKVLGWYY